MFQTLMFTCCQLCQNYSENSCFDYFLCVFCVFQVPRCDQCVPGVMCKPCLRMANHDNEGEAIKPNEEPVWFLDGLG